MTFRHPLLLRLAAKAPHCFGCGKSNEGDVVAAHSNQGRDGKGASIKASDAAIAYFCAACHHAVDAGRKDQDEAVAFWEAGHRATMRYLVESGHFIVSPVPTPPPVIETRPKAKIPKRKMQSGSRPIQSSGFEKPATPRKIQSRGFQAQSPIPRSER
ncbi:DUF1364 family protein [Caulobacter sp. FWC2]|uniref:DUF1364 family protein n=1 Tax=Caulobacter sp. FWC2 TaxID=69664 RepID=UPI000C154EDF|nr:DUF1364 family protein [Caulobacter sp. FWC2]PIB91251.1 hypothetical protein CSW62_06480 [Caulobacter sp. FWC2]